MTQYADCYCLIDSRDRGICERFLNEFFSTRLEAAVDYLISNNANFPAHIYSNVYQLMEYLEMNPHVEYLIYWQNLDKESKYKHAMIFYTDDGKIIAGASIAAKHPDDKNAIDGYLAMKDFLNAEIGCITIEEVAPTNSSEFKEFCKNRFVPNVD